MLGPRRNRRSDGACDSEESSNMGEVHESTIVTSFKGTQRFRMPPQQRSLLTLSWSSSLEVPKASLLLFHPGVGRGGSRSQGYAFRYRDGGSAPVARRGPGLGRSTDAAPALLPLLRRASMKFIYFRSCISIFLVADVQACSAAAAILAKQTAHPLLDGTGNN